MYLYTLREVPAEAEIASHILLLRGGYIRKLVSGIYGFMPLGRRVLSKVENIVREEMDMEISITENDYLMTVNHTYPDFAITMHAFLCKVQNPKFVMKEHVDSKWMYPQDMPTLDWAEADKPIVEKVMTL